MKTLYDVKAWFNPIGTSDSDLDANTFQVYMACQCDQVWKELKMSDGTPWGHIHDIFCSNTQLGIYIEKKLYDIIKRSKGETLSITCKRYGTLYIRNEVPQPTFARLRNEDEILIRKFI